MRVSQCCLYFYYYSAITSCYYYYSLSHAYLHQLSAQMLQLFLYRLSWGSTFNVRWRSVLQPMTLPRSGRLTIRRPSRLICQQSQRLTLCRRHRFENSPGPGTFMWCFRRLQCHVQPPNGHQLHEKHTGPFECGLTQQTFSFFENNDFWWPWR